uniref:Uncharacterized protein n=1 Tax=Anopheles arabiensis TaxID=7173 RepID=A0A182HGW8_ANOAR
MKQVICLVILGLFCSNAVLANRNEKVTAEAAVLVNGKNVIKTEAAEQSGRLVNGVAADIAKYPFAITLRLYDYFYCGATVISFSHALTAAETVYSFRSLTKNLTLYGGTSSTFAGGVSFQVIRIAIHPGFNPIVRESDFNIAVLTVPTNAFVGKRNIAPIPLGSAEVEIGTKCTVLGSGITNIDPIRTASTLRSADMIISSQATCARVWAPLSVKITSKQVMLCAKGANGTDLCRGDIGSALVCRGRLTGISFIINMQCDKARDTGYMKITAPGIRSFIRSQSGV